MNIFYALEVFAIASSMNTLPNETIFKLAITSSMDTSRRLKYVHNPLERLNFIPIMSECRLDCSIMKNERAIG